MRMPAAPTRRTRPKLISAATTVAALSVAAGTASAGGGGGIDVPDPPNVTDVTCIEQCAGLRVAAAGSRVKLTGRDLAGVETVTFASDDVRIAVPARRATSRRVVARVPSGAVSGRPRAKDGFGNGSTSPERLRIVAQNEIPEGGEFQLARAEAKPRKAYFDARRDPAVSYTFRGDGPTDVRVDVIDRRDNSVVSSFRQRNREPYASNVARWDGRRDNGRVAPDGRYKFRIGPVSGGGAETTNGSRFSLYGHKFPLRARHSYGQGFGAGRGHQGQDVLSDCGSKLVAARGGRVTYKSYQSAAGNYVVIRGRKSRFDYMYAHLKRPASVRAGERVRTGETLGRVGSTGNATACLLHFEVWRGDWQMGGSPLSKVTRLMKRWDSWS